MNRTFLKLMLLAVLYLPASSLSANEEVRANAAISIQQSGEIWAGQQVTLNLDLKTTGLSFSNSHFNLPEVDGAFLMQTDTTTIKTTETIQGETWQIVSYPLALYPQKTGQLRIPSIGVRFSTSTGFGSKVKAFEFQTEPLDISVNLPPGAKEGTMLVTTTSFELDHNWQPQSGKAQSGDAFTLTVSRRANDISAMLLPPLPMFETEGLAAYPQAPEVNDRTNRGDLTGERIDSIIWVVEKPGTYHIPGIRFQWWDPDSRELKQQVVPGISLDAPLSPSEKTEADGSQKWTQSGNLYLWILAVIATFFAAIVLWLGLKHRASRQAVDTEKSAFAILQNACKSHKASQSHCALHAWIAWISAKAGPNSRPVTLNEFALACDDTQFTAELAKLQEALVSSNSNWQGSDLLVALRRIRGKINRQETIQSNASLAPLNP
jgi:hypothetical protein